MIEVMGFNSPDGTEFSQMSLKAKSKHRLGLFDFYFIYLLCLLLNLLS